MQKTGHLALAPAAAAAEQQSLFPFFQGRMPLPPSIDAAYQVIPCHVIDKQTGARSKKYRMGPSQALTDFKEVAAWTLKAAKVDRAILEAIQSSRIKTPLAVTLRVYFPTSWRRDLDGPIKFAIDAAFQSIGLNDNLVVQLQAEKRVDRCDPRIEVDIRCALLSR